jgi:hypothetical protein
MDNYQNIYQNNENSTNNVGVTSKVQLQFKTDDFYNHRATDNDGFYYTLVMHKSARLLLFAKTRENITESQLRGHCLWVDDNSKGRYQMLDQDHVEEVKLVPAEFVRAKYSQSKYFFGRIKHIQNIISQPRSATDKRELAYEVDSCLIRLIKLLIQDATDIENMGDKLSLTIRNIADNTMSIPGSIPDLMKNNDDEWLSLKFSNDSYHLNEAASLQENDNILYYIAIHKTSNHIIFAIDSSSKFKTTAVHYLYISQDDGLARYRIQTNGGTITKQFFVPADFVAFNHNSFIEFFDDFKKLLDTSDVYSRQTIWCKLQDNAIFLMSDIRGELEGDLKKDIDESLEHHVMSLASTIRNPNSFDEFYNKVIEREKGIRLQNREKTYPNSLIIFNRRNRTAFIIHINNFENDIFYLDEKIRILVLKYDPDYYVMVGEAWGPSNHEIQQRISSNYRHGDIIKLPSHEKTEILTFIGKTKNSINLGSDKSEGYEIIREKQYDENSRIIDLRKICDGKLDFTMEYHDWV